MTVLFEALLLLIVVILIFDMFKIAINAFISGNMFMRIIFFVYSLAGIILVTLSLVIVQ